MVSDERYYDYMGRRMREEQEKLDVIKEEHTHTSGLMLDMKELTKCHYDVLIRNKELVEENEKLRKEIACSTRTAGTNSWRPAHDPGTEKQGVQAAQEYPTQRPTFGTLAAMI